jgi:glycopeptide antibiotics resistance protein
MKGYRVLYYGLIFIPFGFFLAFFKKGLSYRPTIRRVVAGASIVVPAAVLDSVLMGITTMRIGRLLLGMIFTAAAMLLFSPLESV